MANYPVKVKYPYDDTGTALSNFVDGELHDLTPGRSRVLVMRAGPFFTHNYMLREYPSMRELRVGEDYTFETPYDAAQLATGLEVGASVTIRDNSRTGKVVASYNVPGAHFSYYDAVILEAVQALIDDNRNISFDELKGRPELYPPAFHMHNADLDIYGLDPLVEVNREIRDAIMLRNVESILDPLKESIESKVSRLGEHKVSLRNCTYRDSSLQGETFAFVLRLPMTKNHASEPKSCSARVTVSGANETIDDFIVEWHERDVLSAGGEDNHLVSKVGRNNLPWKIAIVSEYVDEVSIAFIINDVADEYHMHHSRFCVTDYIIHDIGEPELLDTARWELVSKADKSRFDGKARLVDPIIDETQFVNAKRPVMLDISQCFSKVDDDWYVGTLRVGASNGDHYFDFTANFEVVFEVGDKRIVSNFQVLGRQQGTKLKVYNTYLDGNAPMWLAVKSSVDGSHICIEAEKHMSGYVVLKSVVVPENKVRYIEDCYFISDLHNSDRDTEVRSQMVGNFRVKSNHKVSLLNATHNPINDNNLSLKLPTLKNSEFYKLTVTVFDRLLTRQTIDSFELMIDSANNVYVTRIGTSDSHGCHVRTYQEHGYRVLEFAAVDSENHISHSTSYYAVESLVVFTDRPEDFEVPMLWASANTKDNSGNWHKPKDPSVPELENMLLDKLARQRADIDALISDKANLSYADFASIRSKRWATSGQDLPRLDQMRSEIQTAVQGKSVKVSYRVIPGTSVSERLHPTYSFHLKPNTKYLFTNFTASSYNTDKNATYPQLVQITDSRNREILRGPSGPFAITAPSDGVLIIRGMGVGNLTVTKFATIEVA